MCGNFPVSKSKGAVDDFTRKRKNAKNHPSHKSATAHSLYILPVNYGNGPIFDGPLRGYAVKI